MELAGLVASVVHPARARGAIVAFVGAGGKTSGLYALAEELAATGARVLVTTTTMIHDGRFARGLERTDITESLYCVPRS